MKTKLIIILMSLIGVSKALLAQVPFVCQGQYFLSLSAATTSSSGLYLVEIDPLTGNTVFNSVAVSLGATVNAMGYRSTDNFIYGINPTPPNFNLYRVGADGVAVDLGEPIGIINEGHYYYAGDVTPDGNYLVLIGQKDYLDQAAIIAKVDLNDPNYQVTSLVVNNPFTSIYDIAFDPTSGVLYGFSTGTGRLVTININSGEIASNFPVQSQVNQLGALFFDVSGNLFGYGRISGNSTLVSINKATGVMTAIAQGPPSGGEDGCSCPYTVELKKVVSPNVAVPCTEVVYSFIVNNASGIEQMGLQLTDVLPEDFTLVEVLNNPLGGTVILDGHFLNVNGMTVPVGSFTIEVLVEIGADVEGIYQNQAVLSGLPPSLGAQTLSDNPFTFVALDSTPIEIVPLAITNIQEYYTICLGDELELDVSMHGVDYLWDDGADAPVHTFDSGGEYSVTVSSDCEQVVAAFVVEFQIDSIYQSEEYFLCSQDTLQLDVGYLSGSVLWDNGAQSNTRLITDAGDYDVVVSAECEQFFIHYHIISESYGLDIIEDEITVELGDQVVLLTNYWAGNTSPIFEWIDPLGSTISCIDCPTTDAFPLNETIYILSMKTEACTYSDQILVRVKKDRSVFIPNVFSPNDDGINDFFYIQSPKKNFYIKKMSIFDRWGNLVFLIEDIDPNQPALGWDGYYGNKPVQSGVFTYMIELSFIDGVDVLKTGDVTVIRE